MYRFAIIDDHPIVRGGLKEIIAANFHAAEVEEYSRGYDFLAGLQKNKFDIVLLDITLPDMNGIEVLEEIKKKAPRIPVLVVSMHSEEDYAIRAIKAGAYGYVSKRTLSNELVEGIRKVLSGRRYVSPAFADKLLLDFETYAEQAPHEKLSARELQVLIFIGKGKTVNQVADELHLSADTVRTYRARILQKLGLKGTSQLMHYAITRGLVQ